MVTVASMPTAPPRGADNDTVAETTLRGLIAGEPGITTERLHTAVGGNRRDLDRRLRRIQKRHEAAELSRGDRWLQFGTGWFADPGPVKTRDRHATNAWQSHIDAQQARLALSELTAWMLGTHEALTADLAASRTAIHDLCIRRMSLPDPVAQALTWQFSHEPSATLAELARIGGRPRGTGRASCVA